MGTDRLGGQSLEEHSEAITSSYWTLLNWHSTPSGIFWWFWTFLVEPVEAA